MLALKIINRVVRWCYKNKDARATGCEPKHGNDQGEIDCVSNEKTQVDFHFCFFEFGRPPKLIDTKSSSFSFSLPELYTLILSSQQDLNRHQSINVVSDYMMAMRIKDSDKAVMLKLRDAGTEPLLAALLFEYGCKLMDEVKQQHRLYGHIDKVKVFFLIRAGSEDVRGFANTCFTLQVIPVTQRDEVQELNLRDCINEFLRALA